MLEFINVGVQGHLLVAIYRKSNIGTNGMYKMNEKSLKCNFFEPILLRILYKWNLDENFETQDFETVNSVKMYDRKFREMRSVNFSTVLQKLNFI